MAGDDVAFGGTGNDAVDGGAGKDLLFGDNALVDRTLSYGDFRNPRFRVLAAGTTQMYSTTYATDGTANVGSAWQLDPGGAPAWADFHLFLLDHTDTTSASFYGNDYMAGGAGDDTIFGQLGNDVIQGDGSIDSTVGASRDSYGLHAVAGSASADGSDYVEGGGGSDVIFGGLGQDDLIGGSSGLFNLGNLHQRPDVADLVFGGDGTRIDRNNDPSGTSLHGPDADTIVGDNGSIFRLVSVGAGGASSYLRFTYDIAYGSTDTRLTPRPVQLLDYTPGGPDYRPDLFPGITQAAAATAGTGIVDVWGADEIHGEGGDDTVYAGGGNDIVFGDAASDDLVGGWGSDWISGGSGDDGVIGDDGHVFTSRNGLTEPLNGLTTANQQATISTPGSMQVATTYPTGQLTKVMDLLPFALNPNLPGSQSWVPDPLFDPQFADDLLYGGLGNDWLHGGSGVDGISGAEALPLSYAPAACSPATAFCGVVESDWAHPVAYRGILRYGVTRSGMFDLYDQYDPRRIITLNSDGTANKSGDLSRPWLLNFDATEGPLTVGAVPTQVHTDGSDVLFGDNGADWLVGGTGNDTLWGGWGNDMLNADDDLSTNGGLNDVPDTNSTYEDRAYGGSGLDVLMANTGGDRLIDWVGEFNSYLVPFAPFGEATVSRTLQPALMTFLYALSKAQGADPYLIQLNGGDPARNGEPLGEIGLVDQGDPAWHDQTGGPRDPQAGNIPGGKRDVLRSAAFSNATNALDGFFVDSGSFTVSNGALTVGAGSLGLDAAAVFNVQDYLPVYYEVAAQVLVAKPTGGWKANAFIIFDYQGRNDFKFAGLDASTNKVVLGHRDASGWVYDVQGSVSGSVSPNKWYSMLVAVNGTTVTVSVAQTALLTYTFAPRIIDGKPYGLNKGLTGMGSNNSIGQFDNVAVQVLPPQVTYDTTSDLTKGTGILAQPAVAGTWTQSTSGYAATAPTGARALVLAVLGSVTRLSVTSWVDVTAVLSATGLTGLSGLLFDYYATNDYKFAVLDTAGQRVLLGHVAPRSGWTVDASVAMALRSTTTYTLDLVLKGASSSLTVNGTFALSTGWNAGVSGGRVGLLTAGTTTFTSLRARTDDPGFLPADAFLLASASGPGAAPADQATVGAALAAAEAWWVARGVDPARLATVRTVLTDLPGAALARTDDRVISVSLNAAGWGWSLGAHTDRIDLVTVLAHELGHLLGLEHEAAGLMAPVLAPGVSWVTFTVSAAGAAPARSPRSRGLAPRQLAPEAVVLSSGAAAPAELAWGDEVPSWARHGDTALFWSIGTADWATLATLFA
jgi:hypothetical protein